MSGWLKLVILVVVGWGIISFVKKEQKPAAISEPVAVSQTSGEMITKQDLQSRRMSQGEVLMSQGFVYADESKADPNCVDDPLGQLKVDIYPSMRTGHGYLTDPEVTVKGDVSNPEDVAVLEVCIRMDKYKKCQMLTFPSNYRNSWSATFAMPDDVEGHMYSTVKAMSGKYCAIDLEVL